MFKNSLILCALLIINSVVYSHEVSLDEHTQLIPIPEYSQPYGKASAQASLNAANTFLAAFSDSAKNGFVFDLDSDKRLSWSNLPAGLVKREGISLGEMSDEQRTLLFEFLASSLGNEGYESISEVMAAEAFLSTDERAQRLQWAPENYWISFYGLPCADCQWGWQFGGHHLALNLSVENNRIESMSPSFVGTEPAIFTYEGVEYTAVIDMHKAGYAVFSSLDENQQLMADAKQVPEDILTGPGKDGEVTPMIGLSAVDMNSEQRQLLVNAVKEWVLIQPDENSLPRMQEIEKQLDKTRFAWLGKDEVNTPTYMRIQGPTLIIELLSTGGNVGQSASGQGHYHTIYRNLDNEYGTKQH